MAPPARDAAATARDRRDPSMEMLDHVVPARLRVIGILPVNKLEAVFAKSFLPCAQHLPPQ